MADILIQYCQDNPAFRFGGDEFCILFKIRHPGSCRDMQGIQAELRKISDVEGIRE